MKSMWIAARVAPLAPIFYLRDCIDFLADKIKFLSCVCGQCCECPDLVW